MFGVCVGECVNSEEGFVFNALQDPSGAWIHNELSTRAGKQREPVSDTAFTFTTSCTALSDSLHSCLYSVSTGVSSGHLLWISISCSALSKQGYWCEKTKQINNSADEQLSARDGGWESACTRCQTLVRQAQRASGTSTPALSTAHLPFRQI